MTMNRVIVFGSRNWLREYDTYVARELEKLPADTLIVHGACRTGADAAADFYARARGLEVETHPAIWKPEGPQGRTDYAAGPRRNKHMAGLGARLAIGFRMPGKSSGTDNMWSECVLAGIPVARHGWNWPSRW